MRDNTTNDMASGRATHEQSQQAVSAVPVGIPDAARLIAMMSAYVSLPSTEFRAAYPEYVPARQRAMDDYGVGEAEAALHTFVDWADEIYRAKAIEARSGGTACGSDPQDESAGRQASPWESCRKGSCRRHRECMYFPCLSRPVACDAPIPASTQEGEAK